MIPGRHEQDPEELKSLVAEQPGWLFTLIAVAVALFFGLAFRAMFSPEKITALVHKAAASIHPDLTVRFERASLSLADGILPELAVVIENVTAFSENPCWMRPEVKVDQVRLPLELIELVRGRVRLATVDIGQSEAQLRSEKNCERVPASATPAPSPATSAKSNTALHVTVEKANPVETVLIRSLRIRGPTPQWSDVEFHRVKVHVPTGEKRITARGLVRLPLDPSLGAPPTADFHVLALDDDDRRWDLQMQGHWREGRFRVNSNGFADSPKVNFKFEAEHVPLGPLLGFLRQQQILKREMNGRNAWLSVKASGESTSTVLFEDLKVEGDIGEIEARQVELSALSPLKAKPFSLSLRGVRLEKLLGLFELESPSPILGELGSFNGELQFRSERNFELNGEHSGLQFVFANRGQREVQTLSLVSGKAVMDGDKWTVILDRLRPLEGLFLGSVKLQADPSWKRLQAHLQVDELSLSPAVQRLMTGGGSLGRWSGDLNVVMNEGKVENLAGQLLANELVVESLAINRAALAFRKIQRDNRVEIRAKKIKLPSQSPIGRALTPYLNEKPEDFESDQMTLILTAPDFSNLHWGLEPMKIGKAKISSQGQWSETGALTGTFLRVENGHGQSWSITGTRAKPVLEPLNP